MGPMAEDLRAAFGLGADDEHISTVDADGVALIAIQELYEVVREKDAQIAAEKERVAALEVPSRGRRQDRRDESTPSRAP